MGAPPPGSGSVSTFGHMDDMFHACIMHEYVGDVLTRTSSCSFLSRVGVFGGRLVEKKHIYYVQPNTYVDPSC